MDRQVTVTLKAGQQSNVSQQFKEAAAGARELTSEADKFWRKMQEHAGLKIQREQMGLAQSQQSGSFGARAQQFMGGMAGGVNPMAMMGRAGVYGAAGAAVLGVANQGIKTATNVYETLNDSTRTLAQKQRDLVNDYVPFAASLRALIDAQTGLADHLNRNAINVQQGAVESQARGAAQIRIDAYGAEGAQRSSRARELGQAATASMSLTMPSGARDIAGLRAQEAARAMLPHDVAGHRAKAEHGALTGQVDASRMRIQKLQGDSHEATRKMNEAGKRVQNLRDAEEQDGRLRTGQIDSAATEYRLRHQEQQQTINRLKAEEARLQDLTNQKAQAGLRVREVEAGKLRERAGLLRAEADRQSGQMTAFGSLNRSQQVMAVQAAKMFKAKGYDALPPQYRAALSGAGFGEKMQMEAMKSAEKNPMFNQIRESLGLGKADLAGIQKQAAKAELQAAIQVNLDAAEVAEQLKEKMGPIIKDAIMTLNREAGQAIQSDQVGRMQSQNARR